MDDATCKFAADEALAFQHPYPATKIMFMPDKEGAQPDLLATTGDFLRIWQLGDDGVSLVKLLSNVRELKCLAQNLSELNRCGTSPCND